MDFVTRKKIAEKVKKGEFKLEIKITTPKLRVLNKKYVKIAKEFCSNFNNMFKEINAEILV
jgi:hypothetical protein